VVAGTYSQGLISFPHIIGKSPAMRKLYDLVGCLADVPTTVLITGESGTGKELVAEALHHGGVRRNGPLVKVNCAALSETLLESELFGHVRGAFTGADKDRAGRFQMADGGTIFLDEIGDISAGVQARLLRILESMELERVGDSTPMKIDVRIIAATNKDMPEQIQNGSFRKDLYYRLKVVDIPILPLRERKEDIPLLVEHFIGKLNAKLNKTIQGVSSDVMKIFNGYGWPGNVRELEHAVEHAFIHCRLPIVTVCDLPHDIREFIKTKTTLLSYRGCDERQAILRTLEATRWNKTRAAELLGMSRRTFYRKIKEHNIFR
jgi:two-component system response regulator HydG